MKDFLTFIRERGVAGFAIGFIVGGAVSKLVTALVVDIINPLLSLVLQNTGQLAQAKFVIGNAEILWGHFLMALIDFLILAFVVYFLFKKLGLERLDAKKKT
ncbi:MAG: MscL family protein [bacterium]|nr:MscL family protein [bacterium]